MRLALAMLVGASLFAQQGQIIPADKRVDVSAFTYNDFPHQNHTFKVSESKGKVVVVAFLSEGFKAAMRSVGEVRWLQEKEVEQGMVVVPVYDTTSRMGRDHRTAEMDMVRTSTSATRGSVPAAGPDGIGSLGGSNSVSRLPMGDGMFKNQPVSFKVFREFSPNAHTALFPKFEGQPAIFVLDRQGRIATTLFGYEKGQITKAVRAVIEEK